MDSKSRTNLVTKDAESCSGVNPSLKFHPSGVRLNDAHQSVIAQEVNNAQGVNFLSKGSSGTSDAPHQFIHAKQVDIQGGVSYKTENYFSASEDPSILAWLNDLSATGFEEKQNENCKIARKGNGSGKWLLESQEFSDWIDGESRSIWCYGMPGAGKTILASIIINDVQTRYRSNDVACIYVYFDYKKQKKQDVSSLISSLLAQIIRQRGQITHEVKVQYQAWKIKSMRPSTEEHIQMLKAQIKLFSKVFIVVDALDECDIETNTMEEFIKALQHLPHRTHTLFTSRYDVNIKSKVHADSELEIVANKDDLRRYLEKSIANRQHLKDLINKGAKKHAGFLDKVLDAVVLRSQGMFLLAQLHIDFLASSLTFEDFESGILKLPQDLNEVYNTTLDRILVYQVESKRNLAIKVLTWLVFAERQLTTHELKHAISVQLGDKSLPEERFITEQIWTSACAGIVVIDQSTGVVRLAHYTAEKFLRDKASTIFQNAQSNMAEVCLVYLKFEEFNHFPRSPSEIASRKAKYPLYNYAADHWGDHVSFGVNGNTNRLACEFLSDGPKVMSAFQLMSEIRFRLEIEVTGLHVAAYFGLDKLVKNLVKTGFPINAMTKQGETALHWAAFYGHSQFLKVLIDQGAELSIRDTKGRTALLNAISKEDSKSVNLLIASVRKSELNLEGSGKWTPLRWAAAYGQTHTVELLIKSGAVIDAQDDDGWTALRWAAQRDHKKIVEMLIRAGASVEMPCSDQWTLLEWAAREGRENFIKLLIEKRVNLDVTNKEGWTALRWAVDYGRGTAAWQLIQARVNINKPDNKGLTPLHSAVENWGQSSNKSLIWLLLQNKADINAETELGLTALHIAVSRGHKSLIWLLLHNRVNINAKTKLGLTALHMAAEGGHSSIAYLLLEGGIDINAKNKLGLTALHVAASSGHHSLVMFLLQKGASKDLVDNNKRTPLHCAVIEEHEPTIGILLRYDKDLINIKDDERATALHTVASGGNLKILKLLLAHNPEVDAMNRAGNTPLHCAVSQQHFNLVVCLINHGADFNVTNKKGWTPLHSAAYAGNLMIINELLRLEDVDTTIKNKDGLTPWELSKHHGHKIKRF